MILQPEYHVGTHNDIRAFVEAVFLSVQHAEKRHTALCKKKYVPTNTKIKIGNTRNIMSMALAVADR